MNDQATRNVVRRAILHTAQLDREFRQDVRRDRQRAERLRWYKPWTWIEFEARLFG